jgi:hypothetical protein
MKDPGFRVLFASKIPQLFEAPEVSAFSAERLLPRYPELLALEQS